LGRDGGPLENRRRLLTKRATYIRAALAQVNPTVGDLRSNVKKAREVIREARRKGVQILAFPELMISGYPPEDLLLKESFLDDCTSALHEVASSARGIAVLIGCPEKSSAGDRPFNSCFILQRGKVQGSYRKINLPNYGVFDEKRYFMAGESPTVVYFGDLPVALSICEDVWVDDGPLPVCSRECGAGIAFNISASPYHRGKGKEREKLMQRRAKEISSYLLYVNLLGGQDELVFDGASVVAGPDGRVIARGRAFEEELLIVDIPIHPAYPTLKNQEAGLTTRNAATASTPQTPVAAGKTPLREEGQREPHSCTTLKLPPLVKGNGKIKIKPPLPPFPGKYEEIYRALVLGTRDYVLKNGFGGVILGLSGGIDSALTAAVAVDALGNEMVHAVTMPFRYTSKGTLKDARRLASNLGIDLFEIPIEPIYDAYIDSLKGAFRGRGEDVTEENIQARIRGNILMALSNKFGWLVLTTGNKSELAVGYCTLYGDMAGGFAVIKDVPKTLVYPLCRYRNRVHGGAIIPESILRRKPSAELKPGQLDEDTLPPYPVLDRIIELYVEKDMSIGEIISHGLDPGTVKRVIRMIDHNEYKRRQAPPGVKITPKAFGKDRRLPITNRYKPQDKI